MEAIAIANEFFEERFYVIVGHLISEIIYVALYEIYAIASYLLILSGQKLLLFFIMQRIPLGKPELPDVYITAYVSETFS